MITVCSGFSPFGRRQYGDDFLRTFDRHWPESIQLRVYVEEAMPMPRDACRVLWDIPGASAFRDRHIDNMAAHGREPQSNWKASERAKGYSFKHDAFKFWKQILIPEAAAFEMDDGEILVWLDADVMTTKRIPGDFIERLIEDKDVVFLGREPRHSEIGFWAVRLNRATRRFLSDIAECYKSDAVFGLTEWHSAFVWDHVRRSSQLAERDLTPGGHGHVFPRSALHPWLNHLKGPRKNLAGGR